MRIEEIDKNLKVETALGLNDVVFADVRHDPFRVYGLYDYKNQPVFRRLPEDIAAATNDGVKGLASHTAGGRVRFSTDSPYIAIRCKMNSITHFSHMPLIGTSGFDLYEHKNGVDCYIRSYMPPYDMKNGYESVQYVSDGTMKDYTIHFPLYNDVISLEIGLKEGSALTGGPAYADLAPIVYYGSSITQGGCASKPGSSYPAHLCRWLDADHVNLGFAGSARGEEIMARYIAGLPMSLLVLDYDHNAPDAAHLRATHEPFFRIVRAAQSDLPVIMVSMPGNDLQPAWRAERREIIRDTYLRARAEGDDRVWFVDGETLFGTEDRDACTMDGTHPNDLGFYRMAKGLLPVVRAALGK